MVFDFARYYFPVIGLCLKFKFPADEWAVILEYDGFVGVVPGPDGIRLKGLACLG